MKNFRNNSSREDLELKPIIKQNLNSLSNTEWVDSVGDYSGIQYEKSVYRFNGISSVSDISGILPSTDILTTNGVTFGCFARRDGNDSAVNMLFAHRSENTSLLQLSLHSNNGITVEYRDSQNVLNSYSNTFIDDTILHHYIVNFDFVNHRAKLYVDGILINTLLISSQSGSLISNKTLVGAFNNGSNTSGNFNGIMSEAVIINDNITDTEALLISKGKYVKGTRYLMEERNGTDGLPTIPSKTVAINTAITHEDVRSKLLVNHTNEEGYSVGSGIYTGSIIPLNDANSTQDIFGNTPDFLGKVKANIDFKESSCVILNGTTSYGASNLSLKALLSYDITVYVDYVSAGGYSVIIGGRDSGNDGISLIRNSGKIMLTHNSITLDSLFSPIGVGSTKIRIRWTGTVVELYINDILKASANDSTPIDVTSLMYLGLRSSAFFSTPSGFWGGKIYGLDIVLDGIRKIFPMSETSGSVSYGINKNGEQTGNVINWIAITHGTQDVFHHNIRNGFTQSGSVKLPYKIGGVFSNPVGGHNNAETKLIQEVFREDLGNSAFHYDQTTLESKIITYDDLQSNINNSVFYNEPQLITYLPATDKNKLFNYLKNKTNEFHKNFNSF